MLSLLPDLLNYAIIVPFVFRIVVGVRFIVAGIDETRESSRALIPTAHRNLAIIIAIIFTLGGVMLLFGLFTQLVALIFSIMIIGSMIIKKTKPEAIQISYENLTLLLVITSSLLFLGPGAFSFDLPL